MDASLPLCPRSGSRLNSPFRLQSLHAVKKREDYILPVASNIQTSLKSLADASPTSFHPWSVQECKPGFPVDATFDGKGCTKQTKLPWEEPLAPALQLPEPLQQAFASGLASGGTGRKNQRKKAKKKSQIKVSTLNLCLGLKV